MRTNEMLDFQPHDPVSLPATTPGSEAAPSRLGSDPRASEAVENSKPRPQSLTKPQGSQREQVGSSLRALRLCATRFFFPTFPASGFGTVPNLVVKALLVCAAAALPLGAQVIATRADWHGVQIYFDARLEPPPERTTDPAILRGLARQVSGGVICGDGVHRFWKDEGQKLYLGYDVSVEPGSGPQVFQLRIAPLSLTPKEMVEYGFPEAWKRLSLPRYPVIPAVRVGDTVAFDVVANPSKGRKLVDYLTLAAHQAPGAASSTRFLGRRCRPEGGGPSSGDGRCAGGSYRELCCPHIRPSRVVLSARPRTFHAVAGSQTGARLPEGWRSP